MLFSKERFFSPLLPDLNVSTDISVQRLKFVQKQAQMKLIINVYYKKQYSARINRFNLAAEKQNTTTFKTRHF